MRVIFLEFFHSSFLYKIMLTSAAILFYFYFRETSYSCNFFSLSCNFLSLSASILSSGYWLLEECGLYIGGCDFNSCYFLANWADNCCLSFSRCLTVISKLWHLDSNSFFWSSLSSSCLVNSFSSALVVFWECSKTVILRLDSSRLLSMIFFSLETLSNSLRIMVLSR